MMIMALPFMLCALVLLTSFLSFSTPCNANPEVDALIDVKKMILRDPSNALRTWDPSSNDPCSWVHVICNSEGHVHILRVAYSDLYGAISPKIADLQSLDILDLSHNALFFHIPEALGNLKNLRVLDLSHNQLSNSIPASLGQIKDLQRLHLQFNNLEGPIPKSLSSFDHLSFQGNPELCGPAVQRECPKRYLDP